MQEVYPRNVCWSVLQLVHWNSLQYTATHYNTLRHNTIGTTDRRFIIKSTNTRFLHPHTGSNDMYTSCLSNSRRSGVFGCFFVTVCAQMCVCVPARVCERSFPPPPSPLPPLLPPFLLSFRAPSNPPLLLQVPCGGAIRLEHEVKGSRSLCVPGPNLEILAYIHKAVCLKRALDSGASFLGVQEPCCHKALLWVCCSDLFGEEPRVAVRCKSVAVRRKSHASVVSLFCNALQHVVQHCATHCNTSGNTLDTNTHLLRGPFATHCNTYCKTFVSNTRRKGHRSRTILDIFMELF